MRAGVAVRAFGKRLAGVALDFTLEGPAPWHAFGTGSISVLFWDVSAGLRRPLGLTARLGEVRGRDPEEPLREAIGRRGGMDGRAARGRTHGAGVHPGGAEQLAAGRLVHPDATLRMSQKVLPLGVAFSRFERRQVPSAEVDDRGRHRRRAQPADTLTSIAERFVPGEYFDLDEDQQLTAHAFDSYAGGVRVDVEGAAVSLGHRVVDGYETTYEPDRGRRRGRGGGPRVGGDPESARPPGSSVGAPRRRPSRYGSSTLSVADAASLQPLAQDVSLVNATADAWLAVRDQLPDPAAAVQLVETWELVR